MQKKQQEKMAAALDIKFTCQACGSRGGLHVEVKQVAEAFLYDVGPDVGPYEAGPGDYVHPHPWQEIGYPKNDGMRAWEAPDGVAERAALEEIEVS
jgi:hypothetical protein